MGIRIREDLKAHGVSHPSPLEKMVKELSDSGLPDFAQYLSKRGGLGAADMAGNPKQELGALEAILERQADCTELSKMLYAVFVRAGLQPYFVVADTSELVERFRKLYPDRDIADGHVFIGVRLGKHFRYFDLAIFNNDLKIGCPHLLEPYQMVAVELTSKAIVQDKIGQIDEAKRLVRLALEMNPHDGDAWFLLGDLMRNAPETAGFAEKAYRTSIGLDPNFWGSHRALSTLLRQQGRDVDADAEQKRADELDPNHR